MKNKLTDLRNHLFATLEALQDEDNPMDLDRARTIAAVAREITDTARVEVDFLRVTGNERGTDFLEPLTVEKDITPALSNQVRQ